MTAPEVPGMYFLRANYTWHYSCPEGETVFKHPGMANSLAAICVQ